MSELERYEWNLSKEELDEYALGYYMAVKMGDSAHSIVSKLMHDFAIEEALDETIL